MLLNVTKPQTQIGLVTILKDSNVSLCIVPIFFSQDPLKEEERQAAKRKNVIKERKQAAKKMRKSKKLKKKNDLAANK